MVTTNRKRGLRRLAIATLVPYFGWWLFVGVVSYNFYLNAETELNQALTIHDEIGIASWSIVASGSWARVVRAIYWGGFIPIALVVVLAIAWWIYRGFKPKVGHTSI